jgi:hypothetical protein
MNATTLDRTLSLPDLARAWGWSQQKLYRLVELDAIPHLRIRGRIYFEVSVLERWKASHRKAESHQVEREHEADRVRRRTREEECDVLGIPVDHEFS